VRNSRTWWWYEKRKEKSTALTRDLVVQERMTMFCGEKNSTKGVLANVFFAQKNEFKKEL